MEENVLAQIITGNFEDSLDFTDNFYAAIDELNVSGRLEKDNDLDRIANYTSPVQFEVAINGVKYYGKLSKEDIIEIIQNQKIDIN